MAKSKCFALLAVAGMAVSLSACAERVAAPPAGKVAVKKTASWVKSKPIVTASLSERECLARAMYFESNRSSPDGMLAVGSVVMNRVESGRYGNSICSVVGAPRQFAPGVLSRRMADSGAPMARAVADQVLAGQRHAQVSRAMHFHMAGLKFKYPNMHYVTVAGGNAFYEKRDRYFYDTAPAAPVMIASAQPQPQVPVQPQVMAYAGQSEQNARFGSVITDLNGAGAHAPAVESAAVEASAEIADKPAIAALLAPLPPRRPKLLGLTASPDKHAVLGTSPATLRIAGN